NFGIQEDPHFSGEVREIFRGLPEFEDGYYTAGDRPGLGVEVDEAALRRRPYRPFFFPVIRREDGSIQDPRAPGGADGRPPSDGSRAVGPERRRQPHPHMAPARGQTASAGRGAQNAAAASKVTTAW